MSIINSQPLIGASGNQSTAYNLTRSLRFRSGASAYLNRTPSSTTNQRTFTWSGWVKRGRLGGSAEQYLFSARSANNDSGWFSFYFGTGDTLNVGGWSQNYRATTQVFRDPSAWYHIILAVDTTQATASNRVKVYVNGSEITTFSTSNNPTQNFDYPVNSSSAAHGIGDVIGYSANYYLDGYIAEVNFIDGSAKTPSDFGETDTATGVWKPKKYTGTYGTNGFYLKFDNLTSTSTLGNDSSGNNNTWTVNNISLTSGATYDSMKDVPTLTDADTANYCVMNPLSRTAGTVSDANLQFVGSNATTRINGTMAVSSGKWYYEVNILNAPVSPRANNTWYNAFGFGEAVFFGTQDSPTISTNNLNYQDSGWYKNFSGSNSDTGSAVSNGDVLAVAVDLDANTFTFYKNNTSVASGTIGIAAGTSLVPMIISYAGDYGKMAANFGQRPFAYTPPSGFKALNTFNLPTPTIGATASTQANEYMNVVTWTGDGNNPRTVSGVGFQPDLVWAKLRSGAASNTLYDAVRGTGKVLFSDLTNDEATNNAFGYISAFNSDGFVATAGSTSNAYFNTNGSTYVAWNWKANGSGSSNTSGTISSTVSANTTAGFSIVTYTGNGSTGATVGHGLGVAPSMIIAKSRGAVTSWPVYHSSLGATSWILLNSASAATTSAQEWNNTAPTSTVFTIGSSSANSNQSATYVAYCFAEVAGYSKFGSYTGNGSTDGPFVFTGFRPKFIMIKPSSATGEWIMWDTTRSSYNFIGVYLFANASDAEGASAEYLDLLSNGFKLRTTNTTLNANGQTNIYIAFAENPFKYSLAR